MRFSIVVIVMLVDNERVLININNTASASGNNIALELKM